MGESRPVHLYGAGSLKQALREIADAFEADAFEVGAGARVETQFGASGLLRRRIETGETAHLFASANMAHPLALEAQDMGGPVTPFARNTLCAIAQCDLDVTGDTLLDVLLDENIRVGTSTPQADPSGDYAWELFGRAGKIRPGAFETLAAKALTLTGGPDSERAPEGRNQYGWVMEERKADIFLTYCTNAVLARKDAPGLRIVRIPPALSVGALYGLIVLKDAPEQARALADFILGGTGQATLAANGFASAQA